LGQEPKLQEARESGGVSLGWVEVGASNVVYPESQSSRTMKTSEVKESGKDKGRQGALAAATI
jgi:hypothetical protein